MPHRASRRPLICAVTVAGMTMSVVDSTAVNVAIRPLRDSFGASYADISWVVTLYILAQGAVVPLTGWAAERFGRGRTLAASLGAFTLASALCGLVPNLALLIGFRLVQGAAGGMLIPLGMAILLELFDAQEAVRANVVIGLPLLIGPTLGPVLGGSLIQLLSWRVIFLVNVPIGCAATALCLILVRGGRRGERRPLDLAGLALAVPAMVAVMYALDRSTSDGWLSAPVLALLAAGIAAGALFVKAELRLEHPLVRLRLLLDPTLSRATILLFAVSTAMMGVVFLVPSYAQQVQGLDTFHSGLLLLPQGVVGAAASPLGARVARSLGARPVVMLGVVALILSNGSLVALDGDRAGWLLATSLGLRGLALAFIVVPALSAGIAGLPPGSAAQATGISQALQRVGSSLGVAIVAAVLVARSAAALGALPCSPSQAALSSAPGKGAVPSAQAVCSAARTAAEQTAEAPPHNGYEALVADLRRRAADDGFQFCFLILAAGAVLCVFPAARLPRRPGRAPAVIEVEALAAES